MTGGVREAEITVLGASNLTYAAATWTQGLPDWIGAHVRMFRFWGAKPRLLVPDNLKSDVHKASFYDPETTRSYGAMAVYYGVAFCQPGHIIRRIKQKSKREYASLSSTCWAGCATLSSSRSPNAAWRSPDPGAAERADDALARVHPARAV